MQKILFFATAIIVFMSCTKNAQKTSQSQTASNLISITGDSADFSFVYENGQVTDVLARHNDGGHFFGDSSYTPYAHLSYDSVNYIKATSMDPNSGYVYTEYFLNNDRLPLRIIIYFNFNATDVVDFFYNSQTNLLDSVHDTNDGINYVSAYMQYDDADITKTTLSKAYFNHTIEQHNEYVYDKSIPNVFKTLDPLWYIYHKPFGTYNALNSWVEMNNTDLARLFSQFTYTQVHSEYWMPDNYSDTLHYTLNSAGNLESEWYNSDTSYIRHYNYSN